MSNRNSKPRFTRAVMESDLLVEHIFDRLTLEEMKDIARKNSLFRGVVQGYVGERRLTEFLLTLPNVELIDKIDDQALEKGDLRITYKGEILRLELKSLASDSIRRDMFNETWQGRVRSKATDCRDIEVEGVGTVRTSCLVKGEFDILGVCCLAVDGQWKFMFIDVDFLPETENPGLIKTSFVLNPATTAGAHEDPLKVFDLVLAKKHAKIA